MIPETKDPLTEMKTKVDEHWDDIMREFREYPERERRARWTQYLSSGNSNILVRRKKK